MIFSFTPELRKNAFACLTQEEQAVINYHIAFLDTHDGWPGIKTIQGFGFRKQEEYIALVELATQKLKAFFEEMGIHSVNDIAFEDEQQRTMEGRLMRSDPSHVAPKKSGEPKKKYRYPKKKVKKAANPIPEGTVITTPADIRVWLMKKHTLAEIGAHLGITKQAVSLRLKTAKAT